MISKRHSSNSITIFIVGLIINVACNPTPHVQLSTEQSPLDSVPPPNTEQLSNYDTYCNARFDYCVDYPPTILNPQPESTNGDGRVFQNKKDDAVLTVFGELNVTPEGDSKTLKEQYEMDLKNMKMKDETKDLTITYQKLSKTFYIISGHKQGKIFYQKTLVKADAFAYAILEYPSNKQSIYNQVSEHLFLSFK